LDAIGIAELIKSITSEREHLMLGNDTSAICSDVQALFNRLMALRGRAISPPLRVIMPSIDSFKSDLEKEMQRKILSHFYPF